MTRRIVMALTGLLLAANGCASIQAARAEQARWQALADQATQHYGASSVRVELKGTGLEGSLYYGAPDARIVFGSWRGWEARAVLAHELSHHLLGHRGYTEGPTQELQADARAVQVMQVWGMSERDAFLMMAWRRRGLDRRHDRARGHMDPCDEVVALHAAYPGQIEPAEWVAYGCPHIDARGERRGG